MYLKKINLKNKIALVTGAGKGIGKACAIALAEAGADLINDQSVKPVRRERNPSPGLMSITCHLCGKSELIAPSLKREHYRCSACCKG